MTRHYRTATQCRACGLGPGRFYYMTIMDARVPLCSGCEADYKRAEVACEVRAIGRERAENAAALARAGYPATPKKRGAK